MHVLINAYACSPDMGSEPGMAWNWCVNLAKYCELEIITEGEFRDKIEAVLPTLPQGKNMHFHYNPVSEKVRLMCWNQGDWRFYKYYKAWQRKTYHIAKDICQNSHIDVLHQLNMIGFREPGYLWKLSKETNIPFVWGPIGGLKQFPLAYADDGGFKMKLLLTIKNWLNIIQLKYDYRVNAALNQASVLISSIPDSYKAIKKYKGKESIIIPETGCFYHEDRKNTQKTERSNRLNILWVGKFDFRKRLDIALKSIALINDPDVILTVYGSGTEQQTDKAMKLASQLGIEDQVQWMGNRPNSEVEEAMQKADLFLFTSVSEDTSTVVLEAISNKLPVLCFECCGMSKVIDSTVGHKVALSTPKQSAQDFAEVIKYWKSNKGVLDKLSENCSIVQTKFSWVVKARQMADIYKKISNK